MDARKFQFFWLWCFLPVMAKGEIIPLFGPDGKILPLPEKSVPPPAELFDISSFGIDMDRVHSRSLGLTSLFRHRSLENVSLKEFRLLENLHKIIEAADEISLILGEETEEV